MANLTIKQLRYIEAAGKTGSIAAAATALNISQSSITAAIDVLEAEMGFDLFTRVPAKGLMTTPSGKQSLALISDFLGTFREFEAELDAVGGTSSGVIRLACFAAAAATFLPRAIVSFQKQYPGSRFDMVEGSMDTVVSYLEEGLADMAFTYEEVVRDGQIFQPLVDLPHFALVCSQDPMAKRASVSLQELSGKPMIELTLPLTRNYYSNLFRNAKLDVNIVHASSSVAMIRTMVAANLGFTILNAKPIAVLDGRGGFRAVPLSDPIPPRMFGMVMQARTRQPRAVNDFQAHCETLRQQGHFGCMSVRANE
ncbi:LysR family transcriptional regulator [Litoreibacter arenae]|uniref:Transcriptional regulator, LysR family n=1 Tax=Litoreibacter arenae DSM 19593 TaxID=1123360 RepID=S9RZH2_9RHOB|nr:LysR family transcriptional regulator [Litoreibacter arenae]EPX79389.1 transcriptional regulator, LysR family [Litoreibacter arenae DSM 19593]